MDFVLVAVILVPLMLGLLQVGLVMHVRNTLTAAASEGSRHGAGLNRSLADAEQRTREQIRGVLAGRYANSVRARRITVDGVGLTQVQIQVRVPALGVWGPAVELDVRGHAVTETVS